MTNDRNRRPPLEASDDARPAPQAPLAGTPRKRPVRSQSRTGTEKPVFRRAAISSASGWTIAFASCAFVGGCGPASIGASVRITSTSTNGTRISTPWTMPAQSASRSSWLRMYHESSSAATMQRSFPRPRTVSSMLASGRSVQRARPRAFAAHEPGKLPRHVAARGAAGTPRHRLDPYSSTPAYLGEVTRRTRGSAQHAQRLAQCAACAERDAACAARRESSDSRRRARRRPGRRSPP